MGQYTKKKWQDEVKDQNGNIIQAGTLLSAGNFNPVEAGLANAHIEINNNAAAIREAIPSGKTKLSAIDYAHMARNTNRIRLTGGAVAFVNGFRVEIPTNTDITLPEPPTAGERDDLVFLEVWRALPTDTAGETVQHRIRTVAGVDFKTYPDGFSRIDVNSAVYSSYAPEVTAQGGNAEPLVNPNTASASINVIYQFSAASIRTFNTLVAPTDNGLYAAGNGTQTSKDALKTADGYVYAIPLFRVRRRNSGGFSVLNPNGARPYVVKTLTQASNTTTDKLYLDTTGVQAGDTLAVVYSSTILPVKTYVKRVIDGTSLELTQLVNYPDLTVGRTVCFYDRPDLVHANTIADRDILDLRRQVSLTGFNFKRLEQENISKLLRTELQTKERRKMLKTYHGIRKTPVDASTVFYASLDGTDVAEVGGAPTAQHGTVLYEPAPTGLGMVLKNGFYRSYGLGALTETTVDLFVRAKDFIAETSTDSKYLWNMNGPGVSYRFSLSYRGSTKSIKLLVNFGLASVYEAFMDITKFLKSPTIYIRVTYGAGITNVYVNGVLVHTKALTVDLTPVNAITLGLSTGGYGHIGEMADVMVSNIDRGANFATLPADFTAGYAVVSNAMNGQRKTHSDALVAQSTSGIAKGAGSGHSKGIIKTQAVADTWASGDTVKVSSLAGGIISGVIDSDTALARILEGGTSLTVIKLDTVAGLAGNDEIRIVNADGTSVATRTITAIDNTNRTITINSALTVAVGQFIVEITAASSSPLVRFMNAGTITTVTGTWAGLGTNEATFTLGTNASLVNADLQVDYSLNILAGQGGIPEIYTATLAGEAKGKKLVVGTVAVMDDFKGKVSGSVVENPNIGKYVSATALRTPENVAFTEFNNTHLADISSLDGVVRGSTTNVNGNIPQQLFSFDLVKIVEAKYGVIPSVDKVRWLRENVSNIKASWYGYGSNPAGNKAILLQHRVDTNSWVNGTSQAASTPSLLTINTPASFGYSLYFNADGFIHYLAHTDPSDGVTASSIHTDYVSIEVSLLGKTGYDILVPENPRRDDGLANVLLVRKETKEVVSFFNAVNTDDLVTYGDFVPYQGLWDFKVINYKALTNIAENAFATSYGTGSEKPPVNMISYPVPVLNNLPLGTKVLPYEFISADLNLEGRVANNVKDLLVLTNMYHTELSHPTSGGYRQVKVGEEGILPSTATLAATQGVANISPNNNGSFTNVVNKAAKVLYAAYFLALNTASNELILIVITSDRPNTAWDGVNWVAVDVFSLEGRPIVKGVL